VNAEWQNNFDTLAIFNAWCARIPMLNLGEGFGAIMEMNQVGPTLNRAIGIVQAGRPAVVDVVTQPR
jgi:hypothetical protein